MPTRTPRLKLTTTERLQALQLRAVGLSIAQVARALQISPRTVGRLSREDFVALALHTKHAVQVTVMRAAGLTPAQIGRALRLSPTQTRVAMRAVQPEVWHA